MRRWLRPLIAFDSLSHSPLPIMRRRPALLGALALSLSVASALDAQVIAPTGPDADAADAVIRTMVERLDLERYKATIKGLTAFGDRRQGTARNRAAIDWIEAQLRSYGCDRPASHAARAPGAGGGPP